MNANKIINSINLLLNEDKFAKYSMQQVYDELGKEDFVEYIGTVCTKIIRGLKKEFSSVVSQVTHATDITFPFIEYHVAKDTSGEKFIIIVHITSGLLELSIKYRKDDASFGSSRSIDGDETDVSGKLKSAIQRCYRDGKR